MKITLLADIHANPIALDAVLTDIEGRGGVDSFGLLGDDSTTLTMTVRLLLPYFLNYTIRSMTT